MANGILTQYTKGGKPVPATIHNLVAVIRGRYQHANITVVGVDDVVVKDLTLEWSKRARGVIGAYVDPPLEALFGAISAATEGQVDFKSSSAADFLLYRHFYPDAETPKHVQAFNLRAYLGLANEDRRLQAQITALEAKRDALEQQKPAGDPEKFTVLQQLARKEQALEHRVPDKVLNEKLTELQHEVNEALRAMDEKTPTPTYQFHPGTCLLVVIGTNRALEVAEQVIAAYNPTK